MATDFKPGQSLRVTVSKTVTRANAVKTLERLFNKDKALQAPLLARSKNFKEQPKRRGGQIWTKRPNKLHLNIVKGVAGNVTATAQALKDLASVGEFVEVKAQ